MSTHPQSTIERPALSPSALADRTPASYCTHAAPSSALDLADRLINSPCSSYWLAKNLALMLRVDPVDAVNDAGLLLSVLSARLEEIQGGAK